jgi:hypothetical protein
MTVSKIVSEAAATEWRSAMTHAGLSEEEVHLLAVPGLPGPRAPKAAAYPAGRVLGEESRDDGVIQGQALIEANSERHIGKHRVAFYAGFPESSPVDRAVLGGKLRHELRHVEQRMAPGWGTLFDLEDLALEIGRLKAGGLAGGGEFYNLIPTEIDANAAAAEFLRQEHPEFITQVLGGDDGALARSNTPPGDLGDLPAKLVAFMFIFHEIAEDSSSFPNIPFGRRLAQISDAAARQWRALSSGS